MLIRFDKWKSINDYKILLIIQWKTWNINLQSSLMGAFYNTVARSFERLCSWKQMHSTDFSTSAFMGLSLSSPRARLAALRSMERRTNEDQFSVWSSPWTTVRRSTSAFLTTYMVATHVAAISKVKTNTNIRFTFRQLKCVQNCAKYSNWSLLNPIFRFSFFDLESSNKQCTEWNNF